MNVKPTANEPTIPVQRPTLQPKSEASAPRLERDGFVRSNTFEKIGRIGGTAVGAVGTAAPLLWLKRTPLGIMAPLAWSMSNLQGVPVIRDLGAAWGRKVDDSKSGVEKAAKLAGTGLATWGTVGVYQFLASRTPLGMVASAAISGAYGIAAISAHTDLAGRLVRKLRGEN